MTLLDELPEQEVLVRAIAPALPGYSMSADEWLEVCISLRLLARSKTTNVRQSLFLEDVARAADAMHNRLNESPSYLGKEELDEALGT